MTLEEARTLRTGDKVIIIKSIIGWFGGSFGASDKLIGQEATVGIDGVCGELSDYCGSMVDLNLPDIGIPFDSWNYPIWAIETSIPQVEDTEIIL